MYIGNQRTRHQIRAELIRKMEQLKVSTKQCERLMLEQQIAQLEKEAFKAPETSFHTVTGRFSCK